MIRNKLDFQNKKYLNSRNFYEKFYLKENNRDFKIAEFCFKTTVPKKFLICCTKKENQVGIYARDENENILPYNIFFINDLSNKEIFFSIVERIIDKHTSFNSKEVSDIIDQLSLESFHLKFYFKKWLKRFKKKNGFLGDLLWDFEDLKKKDELRIKKFKENLDRLTEELSMVKQKKLKLNGFDISKNKIKKVIKKYAMNYIKKHEFIPLGIHEILIEFFNFKTFEFHRIIEPFNFDILNYKNNILKFRKNNIQ